MSDEYLRERGSDVRDLARRLISAMKSEAPETKWPEQVVLVADELTPAVLGDVPKENLAGLIAVKGSASSHVAIIARSMGVPCVVGVQDLPTAQLQGLDIVVDGYRGQAVVIPQNPPAWLTNWCAEKTIRLRGPWIGGSTRRLVLRMVITCRSW